MPFRGWKGGYWNRTLTGRLRFLLSCLGKRCVVLGWGTFKGSFRLCESKNYGAHEVEVVNTKECSEYYGAHMITERMICAKSRNETSMKCLGDTGGEIYGL